MHTMWSSSLLLLWAVINSYSELLDETCYDLYFLVQPLLDSFWFLLALGNDCCPFQRYSFFPVDSALWGLTWYLLTCFCAGTADKNCCSIASFSWTCFSCVPKCRQRTAMWWMKKWWRPSRPPSVSLRCWRLSLNNLDLCFLNACLFVGKMPPIWQWVTIRSELFLSHILISWVCKQIPWF
jgi:hypothetical protein